MEIALSLIVLLAFGYFIYTRYKKAEADRAVPPVPGQGGGSHEPNPNEQEK